MNRNTPNFLIIGAQKCGTSWLFHHLGKHPDVFLPPGKELEFFSYRNHLENPGFIKYLENFSGAGPVSAIGEATPSYFWTNTHSVWCNMPHGFQKEIPKVVKKLLGADIRLIVSLRNPAERALSAFAHYIGHGELPANTPFARALGYGGIIDMGFYYRHLINWLEYFEPDRFLILTLENDIRAEPAKTLQNVFRFLGLEQREFDEESIRRPVFAGPAIREDPEPGVRIDLPGEEAQPSREDNPAQDPGGIFVGYDELRRLKQIFHEDVQNLDKLLGTRLELEWGFGENLK